MAGVSLALLLAVEGVCRLALRWRTPEPTVQAALADEPWAAEYQREFAEANVAEWRSYVYWRRKPYRGRWIQIDGDGIRRTWRPERSPTPDTKRVFVLGGSTVWGTGARDEHTIPSCLARELEQAGLDARVRNLGETGHVLKQQLIALLGELERGHVPDLVVAYAGVNEAYAAYQSGEAGLPHNEWRRREQFDAPKHPGPDPAETIRWAFPGILRVAAALGRRLTGTSDEAGTRVERSAQETEELAAAVAEHVGFLLHTLQGLGREHGFEVLLRLQPTLLHKPERSPHEAASALAVADVEPFLLETYRRIRAHPELGTDPDFADASAFFADTAEPLYLDWCHLTEAGNARIGAWLALDVRRRLRGRGE